VSARAKELALLAQIRPAAERSSLRQAGPGKLSGTAAKFRRSLFPPLSGLPLFAALFHYALGVRRDAVPSRMAVANTNRIALFIETSHRVLVFR
jgi:hypothetical protein